MIFMHLRLPNGRSRDEAIEECPSRGTVRRVVARMKPIVCLSGGVGGARFLRGLAAVLPPEQLIAIVNTGDDFEHWGLSVCPDLDTVMYTLAGVVSQERGWGLDDESFRVRDGMQMYGEPDWFALGDRDLATHLTRSRRLREGKTLSEVTAELCRALGVEQRILPMADGPCRTRVHTPDGVLGFQEWFVRERARPLVQAVRFAGDPPATRGVLEALGQAELVLIGPSNPYVSIDPILSRAGMGTALVNKTIVAVSPIVGGKAVKGPLAEMIPELAGEPPSAAAIARHYGELLSGLVVEAGDESEVPVPVLACRTLMTDQDAAARLAEATLGFARELAA